MFHRLRAGEKVVLRFQHRRIVEIVPIVIGAGESGFLEQYRKRRRLAAAEVESV